MGARTRVFVYSHPRGGNCLAGLLRIALVAANAYVGGLGLRRASFMARSTFRVRGRNGPIAAVVAHPRELYMAREMVTSRSDLQPVLAPSLILCGRRLTRMALT